MESIDINDYLILSEKLAYINGYLHSIAILNTIPNNAMSHWMIDLGEIETDLNATIKKAIQAPNWTFKAKRITVWEKVVEDDCYYFFAEILYKIQGSKAYYENEGRQYDLMGKYNLDNQLKYFIRMLADLFSFCKLKEVYSVDVDSGEDRYNPYFAHGEYNYAFKLESGKYCIYTSELGINVPLFIHLIDYLFRYRFFYRVFADRGGRGEEGLLFGFGFAAAF